MQKLTKNIAALSAVQFISLLLPLITLPYVTRVLGVNAWGTVALVQIVVSQFIVVTNWGFGMSGTRKVAAARNDPYLLSEIFVSAWLGQWLLAAGVIALLIFLVIFLPFFNQYAIFYLISIGGIIANILFPVWFLNGVEKIQQVAFVQIITRIINVPLVFIFITKPGDAHLMLAINAVTLLLGGVITVIWMHLKLDIFIAKPGINKILSELREGANVFVSSVSIGLYTTFTPLLLGIYAGNTAVGYYSLADRARMLTQSVLSPISEALFPRLSHLFNKDAGEARSLLKISSVYIITLSAVASLFLWILAEQIVFLMAGEEFRPAIIVLKWLAPLPLIISISNIFGIQILLPNRKNRAFNVILALAGALSLVMTAPMIYWRGAEGASINVFIIESFVALSMYLYLTKIGFFKKAD